MSFATYTNREVKSDLVAGQSPTQHALILGCFAETSEGNIFEYAERRHPDDDFAPEMPHMIFVGNAETRLARVLKTVAYIVVDEDAAGHPVIEKWDIKAHRDYDTQWVRA